MIGVRNDPARATNEQENNPVERDTLLRQVLPRRTR